VRHCDIDLTSIVGTMVRQEVPLLNSPRQRKSVNDPAAVGRMNSSAVFLSSVDRNAGFLCKALINQAW